MKDSAVSENIDEFSSLLVDLDQPSPHLATSPGTLASLPLRSYQPYPWSLPNRVLDFVDARTHGRAGWLQRIISYLFFGGLAALVNLAVFYVMYYHLLAALPAASVRYILSYIAAAELSIIANFIPNDRFTFNKLPGARRPWLQRCARFHTTTIVGSLLTFLIGYAMTTFLHAEPIISEAAATLLVLIYNFSFHHIFTYRHIKHA